jgi:hypothetical protein
MKRGPRGEFAKELECGREDARPALYQRRWRSKKNVCSRCAKRPKAPGLSRCGECNFGEHNPEAEDVVDVLNSKPNRMRSYKKMTKAKRPE